MQHCVSESVTAVQRVVEGSFVGLCGGVLYYGLETVWRGNSHWTMALCGALGFWRLYCINRRYLHLPLPLRALFGAFFLTWLELIAGSLLNLGLGLDIWDYRTLPWNLLGQICLPYSILWFLLCFPCAGLCFLIRRAVFLEDA